MHDRDRCTVVASEVAARKLLELVTRAAQGIAPAALDDGGQLGESGPIARLSQPLAEEVLGTEPLHGKSCYTGLVKVLELLSEVAHRLERGQGRGPPEDSDERISRDEADGPVV